MVLVVVVQRNHLNQIIQRAFSDISAQSIDFEIYVKGKQEAVSSTSCSSPTAAGIYLHY